MYSINIHFATKGGEGVSIGVRLPSLLLRFLLGDPVAAAVKLNEGAAATAGLSADVALAAATPPNNPLTGVGVAEELPKLNPPVLGAAKQCSICINFKCWCYAL